MQIGDLVKDIVQGLLGIVMNMDVDLVKVMFSDGVCRWYSRTHLEVVCK